MLSIIVLIEGLTINFTPDTLGATMEDSIKEELIEKDHFFAFLDVVWQRDKLVVKPSKGKKPRWQRSTKINKINRQYRRP